MRSEDSRLAIVLTDYAPAGLRTAAEIAEAWTNARPGAVAVAAPPARHWPFMHPLNAPLERETPTIVWMPDLHEAFVNRQTGGTRLVTTHPSYLLQTWLDSIEGHDVLLLATADRATLAEHAPEVVSRRGLFQHADLREACQDAGPPTNGDAGRWQPAPASIDNAAALDGLVAAFSALDPSTRLAGCVAALDRGPTAPALVATASACMEVNDLDAAARDLDEAVSRAPDWAAAHFERGKLWLRSDDMDRAAAAFRAAADRMPRFGPSWANLGAALGELDRMEEALAAFEHARRCDPDSHQTINNIGVLQRESGQLADAEASFRRVTRLAPDLAFGYYNLGHTLFLQGRYQAALASYGEGQKRDAERNPVQASRLAMCRLATGDARSALTELAQAMNQLPREPRAQLLRDTQVIALALLTHQPGLAGWADVNGWLTGELAKLA